MMPAMLIVSGFTCLGLAIYANHLYEDRAEVQERLNLVSNSYREALADMEAMRNAAPDIPAPACDPFLELADLNNRIDRLIKEKGLIYMTPSLHLYHTKASQLSEHPAFSSSSGKGGRTNILDIARMS